MNAANIKMFGDATYPTTRTGENESVREAGTVFEVSVHCTFLRR
jgi:hypothetical protein